MAITESSIVVDGHSVDGTPDVARRLRPDVKLVAQIRTARGTRWPAASPP